MENSYGKIWTHWLESKKKTDHVQMEIKVDSELLSDPEELADEFNHSLSLFQSFILSVNEIIKMFGHSETINSLTLWKAYSVHGLHTLSKYTWIIWYAQ